MFPTTKEMTRERNEIFEENQRKCIIRLGLFKKQSEIKTFSHKQSCSPEAHPQDVMSGKATKPEGLGRRVWRDLCWLRPGLEATRPPEKQGHLCGAPLGTEGNPNREPAEQARRPEAPADGAGTDKGWGSTFSSGQDCWVLLLRWSVCNCRWGPETPLKAAGAGNPQGWTTTEHIIFPSYHREFCQLPVRNTRELSSVFCS